MYGCRVFTTLWSWDIRQKYHKIRKFSAFSWIFGTLLVYNLTERPERSHGWLWDFYMSSLGQRNFLGGYGMILASNSSFKSLAIHISRCTSFRIQSVPKAWLNLSSGNLCIPSLVEDMFRARLYNCFAKNWKYQLIIFIFWRTEWFPRTVHFIQFLMLGISNGHFLWSF